jgi:magnesium-protoporphyrin IX monomethyl ester (oxidative) cyclase
MENKIKKILLIAPPAITFKSGRDVNPLPPMGLGYLAAVFEKHGFEVSIFDILIEGWDHEEPVPGDDELVKVGLSDEDIKQHIQEVKPDLIGVNCQFSRQHRVYHDLFALIKSVLPEVLVVAGGAHVTVCSEEVLEDENCDYIIQGEAEESFLHFVRCLNDGESCEAVDGIGFKTPEGPVIKEKQSWIEDLDSIPLPAYHLMKINRYLGLESSHGERHSEAFSPIMTSRGCPAKCTFCSAYRVWGKRYRMRSVDNVIEEMRLLKDEYGIEELMFEDDNVTANLVRAKELFRRMIEEKFDFIWDTPNGVGIWTLDEEALDLMKASGCVKLNFPIESGSQDVLKNIIRKPLDLEKARKLMDYCKKIDLDFSMFLVIGMPGETLRDIWTSIKFAASCKCFNPHISVATPYPGTQLFDICKDDELFAREFTLDDLFIRSYLIRTKDWSEKELHHVLIRAKLYLKLNEFLDDPKILFRWVKQVIGNPVSLINYLKR